MNSRPAVSKFLISFQFSFYIALPVPGDITENRSEPNEHLLVSNGHFNKFVLFVNLHKRFENGNVVISRLRTCISFLYTR